MVRLTYLGLHGLEQGLLFRGQRGKLLLLRRIANNGDEVVRHLLKSVMRFDIGMKQRFIAKYLKLLDVAFHGNGLFGQGTAALQHLHRP